MSAKMSAKDYDECEKLYCGTWSLEWEENVDEFLNISGEFVLNFTYHFYWNNMT